MSVWSKASVSFFLLALFATRYTINNMVQIIVTVVIMVPLGLLLDALAKCDMCHRSNLCVNASRTCGGGILTLIGLVCILFAAAGVYLIEKAPIPLRGFLTNFAITLALEELQPLYMGIWNWLLLSWKGFLCFPQCRCCGRTIPSQSVVPLLGLFPIKFLLNLYEMGESTYYEDKNIFLEKYPNRKAIDDVSVNSLAGPEEDSIMHPGVTSSGSVDENHLLHV